MKNPNSKTLHRRGRVLKENHFETARGWYTIRIIALDGRLFFHKSKDGQVVEIKRLEA